MKYFDTKKDSLEEAISKAINEKPEQLKEEVVAKDLLEAGGKYLKYSDLLLQKGRLMQQGKNTAMIDKEISKEMKKLNIKEGSDEYEKFFQSALKKFKIDSPADLKTDDKKKEFFNYIDKNYKAKEEDLDKEDETSVKKVIKGLKKAVDAHSGQVKTLTKDIQDETDKNVDETLDKIREANIQKGKSMRNILADIWKMNEGKSPFEKEEGFSSDAQRRAAFASGYKEKGKKKKEEVEKSSKTATGQKPTKVEIEPEVKWMKDLQELTKVNEESLPKLYCDMDQVLVAFLSGVKKITGQDFDKMDRQTRWNKISNTKDFWANLDFMPGAKRLVQRIEKYNPYILSAFTDKDSSSKAGKYKWIQKNTKIPKSRILVVKRAQKQAYSTDKGQPSVLIDDYIKNIREWENKGGIGVHHTDVSKTLKELSNLGFK